MAENDDGVGTALRYLAETDEPAANARAMAKYLEQKRKTIKAVGFMKASGTMAEREARSYTTNEYLQFLEDYKAAVYDDELYKNKRKRAELTVEVWRSKNANRRAGNV